MSEEITPETTEQAPKIALIGVSRGAGMYADTLSMAMLLSAMAADGPAVVACQDRPEHPEEGVVYVQEARSSQRELGYPDNRAGRRAERFHRNMPEERFGRPRWNRQ